MNRDADLTTPGLALLVADFLAALSLDQVTLVGNDTGGAICQLLVTEHPEHIGRLVLTPCDAFEHFFPPAFRPLRRVTITRRTSRGSTPPLPRETFVPERGVKSPSGGVSRAAGSKHAGRNMK